MTKQQLPIARKHPCPLGPPHCRILWLAQLLDTADAVSIFARATRGGRTESGRRSRHGRGSVSRVESVWPGNGGRGALGGPADGTGQDAGVRRGRRAATENETCRSRSRAETRGAHHLQLKQQRKKPQRHRDRWHRSSRASGGKGLGFAQFVAAIEGVVELLTVGYGGSGGGACLRADLAGTGSAGGCRRGGILSGRPAPPESSEGAKDGSRNEASPRPSTGELCHEEGPGGAGGEREALGREEERAGGVRGRRRVTVMAPALARRRLVQLAKVQRSPSRYP